MARSGRRRAVPRRRARGQAPRGKSEARLPEGVRRHRPSSGRLVAPPSSRFRRGDRAIGNELGEDETCAVGFALRWEVAPRRRSTVDDARKLQRRAMDRAAPGGRRAAAASRSDFLGPRDVLRGGRGREAVRAQGHPKFVDGAERRPIPPLAPTRARRARPSPDRLESPNRERATRCSDGRQGRARRPYGAPRGHTTRRDGGADLTCPSPGRRVARFGRNPSRALDFSGDVRGEGGRGHHDGTRGGTVTI